MVDAENMPETGIEEEQIINLSEAKKALNDLFKYFSVPFRFFFLCYQREE